MTNKELIYVIQQIGNEKGIDPEILFEALESALLSASKKTMGMTDNVRMEIDRHSGALHVYARKKVVEELTDDKLEIELAAARALNGAAELGDELEIELPPKEFGRIAAQTAKQVILQRVRDAERDAIYAEFADKEGRIVRGTVHRIERRNVIIELGKAEAVIPEREQIPGERYNPNDRVRAYLVEVKKTAKGPQIMLSRTHPGFLACLFETEIPEIAEGIVQVKAAAREPGERAKVAVVSTKRDVDAIGACVGLRGTRIQVISRELRGEKIDIIEWAAEPATMVARALSPAKVASVTITDEGRDGETPSVLVVVPDNQLSLAIGKRGQNARLAAKLTGIRIDIKSEGEIEEERRREEEDRVQGREALSAMPEVGPELTDRLTQAGLGAPWRIVEAGVAAVQGVPGIDPDRAAAIVDASAAWLEAEAQARAARESEAEAALADEGAPASDDQGADASGPGDAARAGAG